MMIYILIHLWDLHVIARSKSDSKFIVKFDYANYFLFWFSIEGN